MRKDLGAQQCVHRALLYGRTRLPNPRPETTGCPRKQTKSPPHPRPEEYLAVNVVRTPGDPVTVAGSDRAGDPKRSDTAARCWPMAASAFLRRDACKHIAAHHSGDGQTDTLASRCGGRRREPRIVRAPGASPFILLRISTDSTPPFLPLMPSSARSFLKCYLALL